MSPSVSSLIVAIVGVLGTLFSGLLAQRISFYAKKMELEHGENKAREERENIQLAANLEARRVSYVGMNRALRDYYSDLRLTYQALQNQQSIEELRRDIDESRKNMRAAYAEGQMIASDEVLNPAGDLVQLLHFLYNNLAQHCDGLPPAESLEDLQGRLDRASEQLYEVRQMMRRDLGLTSAPIERPIGHGVFN